MRYVAGIVTAFAIMLSSGNTSAQGKFSLSVSAAPTFNYSKVKQTILLPDAGNSDPLPIDFASRTTGQGYTIGLLGRYAFMPKWSVSTGVWIAYNQTNQPNIETSAPVTDLTIGRSHARNYQVPILVNFQSSTRRLSPYFSAGVLLNFRSMTYVDVGNDQEIRLRLGKHNVTVVPTIGVGAIYRMSNHLSLSVQPTFNYYLPQGTYSSYFSGRASLQTQLFYTF